MLVYSFSIRSGDGSDREKLGFTDLLNDCAALAFGNDVIRKGTAVPDGTVTAAFNARLENVRTGQREAGDGRLNDWMGGERIYRVSEEVVGLGQYGRTLTVLTCHGLSAEKESEYDDEEGELIESWTPKFRR